MADSVQTGFLRKPPLDATDALGPLAAEGIEPLDLTYAETVLADSPALFWPMDETSGTVATDASGNGNHGTYSGATLNQASLLPGDPGGSVSFDGVNDRITSLYQPAAAASRSFEGWSSGSPSGAFCGMSNGLPDFRAVGSAFIMRPTLAGGADDATWAAALPASAFHWVDTYNYATKTAELWINGVSQGTRVTTSAWAVSAVTFIVGDNFQAAPNIPFTGRQAKLAVYPAVLSGARILAHYNAGL